MKKRFKRIYVEITNICNMSCHFCPPTKRTKEYMSLDNFETILTKIKDYTDYIYLHIKGEPLIHPKLSEILSMCNKYEIMVNITTNGTLVEKNKHLLIANKVRQLNISLHNHHDSIESTINSAKTISENSETIIQYRLWNLKSTSNNSKIIHDLETIYNIDITNEKEKNSYQLDEKTYLNFDYQFKWPNLDNKTESKFGNCEGLKTQLGILVDGSVVPCCLDNDGDIILGNIFEKNLEDIINSKRVTNMLQGFNCNKLVEKLCQKCEYRNRG